MYSNNDLSYTEDEIGEKEIDTRIKNAIAKFIIDGKDVAVEKK